MRRFSLLWFCALAGFSLFSLDHVIAAEALRDPWMQPFGATSIWNTPIGDQSDLVSVELKSEYKVKPELEYVYQVSNQPFTRNVLILRNWKKRIDSNKKIDEIPIDDFLLGAKLNEVGQNTACSALLMPDRQTVKNFCQFCRTGRSSPCFVAQETQWNLFESNGMDDGRLTSGMSILGGALKIDAHSHLTDIDHAVKILLPASELSAGPDGSGFRWPATRTDEAYKTLFKGSNSELTIGSLLTVDSDRMKELDSILTTDFGKSFAQTCYQFGAYVVDYSRDRELGLCMTPEFQRELMSSGDATQAGATPESIQKDLQVIFAKVKVVKNNVAESIGGAGARRYSEAISPLLAVEHFGRDNESIVPIQNGLMTDGELFPTYWNLIPNSRELVDFGFDERFYYSSPRSFRIKSLPGRQIGLYQTVLEKRSPLNVSVRVCVQGKVKLSLAHLSFSKNTAIADKLEAVEFDTDPQSKEWRLFEAKAELPEGQDFYRIMLMTSGDGMVWIDDFDARLIPEAKP